MATPLSLMLLSSLGLSPGAEGTTSTTPAPDPTTTSVRDRGDRPFIRRWAPERNLVHLGMFGGVLFPHPRLELFEYDYSLRDQGFVPLRGEAIEFGLRLAYMPLAFLGVEAEGTLSPTRTEPGARTLLWSVRSHVLARVPRWSVTPFALAGLTGLGVSSDRTAVGNDLDLGFHYGGGVEAFVTRRFSMRVDVRDTMTARRGVGRSVVHSAEILLGVGLTFGRAGKPAPLPQDTDGDGIFDPQDACIEEPGVTQYDGCPIPDTDGDGVLDPDDHCVDTPGVAELHGCPVPDSDGDGILDPDDRCVVTPGVAQFEGCPIPDADGDGILDPDDRCVQQPETDNGYEDDDGCPDEVPKAVAEFTGVIQGIYFDTAQSSIRRVSFPILTKAIAVLTDYPSIHIEISGHTDDRGDDDYNMELSRERAEAVKGFFAAAGIDPARIKTRGAGETQPISSNATEAGRANNRRIEFELLRH